MKPSGLLSALRKYRVRDNSDPIENFVTEAFAWLLKTDSNFSKCFLMSLHSKHSEDETDFKDADWDTQCNWDNKFPDMVCTIGDGEATFVYVFEHKVWSRLHENQLFNYKDYAQKRYSKRHKLVLITAHRGQHEQEYDEALCWSDVYLKIEKYLKDKEDPTGPNTASIRFVFRDFLELLEGIGLAPLGAFQHGEIACYSSDFRYRMNSFWDAVSIELNKSLLSGLNPLSKEKINRCQDFRIEKQPDQWGRIGLTLFRENRPSVFVGVILDVADHGIRYSSKKGPDCVIMLWFDEDFESEFASSKYQELKEHLSRIFDGSAQADGWRAYDHLRDEDATLKNPRHPFYIRKPLVEVIPCGREHASSFESQASQMAGRIKTPLWKTLGVGAEAKDEQEPSLIFFRNTPAARARVSLTNDLFLGRVASYFDNEPLIDSNIWWDKDSGDWALCLKFPLQQIRPVVHLGFNLYKTTSGFDTWFFLNPPREKNEVRKLLESNDFKYLDAVDNSHEHHLKAHYLLAELADSDSSVKAGANFARECLNGLGYLKD